LNPTSCPAGAANTKTSQLSEKLPTVVSNGINHDKDATPDLDTMSALMKLPLELRREIYFHTFSHAVPICIRKGHARNRPSLNLLLTCRQVHIEASNFVYKANMFSFDNPKDLYNFLNQRTQEQQEKIHKLRFVFTYQ